MIYALIMALTFQKKNKKTEILTTEPQSEQKYEESTVTEKTW